MLCPLFQGNCIKDDCAWGMGGGDCAIVKIAEGLTESYTEVHPMERIADAMEKVAGIEYPEITSDGRIKE